MSIALGVAYGTAQHIDVDVLIMKRVAAILVSKDLNFVQKHHRKTVAKEMISESQSDPTMKRIITGGRDVGL